MKHTALFLLIASMLFLSSGASAKPKDKEKESNPAHEKADKQESRSDVEKKLKALPPGLKKKLSRGKSLPPGWQDKVKKGEVLPQDIIDAAIPAPKEIVEILPKTEIETKVVVVANKAVQISKATKEILDVFEISD